MKVALLAALGLVSAVRLNGIDEKTLMEGAHWRKLWPEGAVDNSDDDAPVIAEYNHRKKEAKKEPAPHVWYPYEPHSVTSANEHEGLYHTQVYE
eukprot:CAMPEP_0170493254 /NCGR_PEP_ID=MMETSP0208-20121228/13604_1 /TAXON_ID=197538 /ORGANISM="Strombidium inclinatum, Strain S3" /LENGTH=93 /DNA_ID=CAMNT_0010769153 /DNA_START=1 /DNA_END=282 /DNA_ORIENTATION=+